MTDNRLNNALSKVGSITGEDLEGMIELEELLVEDVREQLELLEAEAVAGLAEEERRRLDAHVVGSVGALIVGRFGG